MIKRYWDFRPLSEEIGDRTVGQCSHITSITCVNTDLFMKKRIYNKLVDANFRSVRTNYDDLLDSKSSKYKKLWDRITRKE